MSFDAAAPLPGAPDPWAGSEMPPLRGGPPYLMTEMIAAEPAVAERVVRRLAAAGTEVIRHPAEKDASDSELALGVALERGADEVVMLGALGGGRLDHELANLLLLADPELPRRDLRIVRAGTTVRVLAGRASLELGCGPGSVVTLLPVGGNAQGVATRGLRYPLDGETLRVGRSRGLSNEVVEAPASVWLGAGTLLVIEIASNDGGEQ